MKFFKSFLLHFIVIILFGAGVLLFCYPFISNYLVSRNQLREIEVYEKAVEDTDDATLAIALKEAQEYNESLLGKGMVKDPFADDEETEDTEYEDLLNINGNSVMGSIEIPVINITLPIYHGTSDEILQEGVGHLNKTSLPVGGKGTHAIIAGHSGLPNAKIFTDLDLLEIGDVFYIHCLNETLAYKVDQIKVVEPDDTDDLAIDPNQDYVTLVTCTPYGVNSHRLLVRGTRIPYEESEKLVVETENRESESMWMQEYKKAVCIGCIVFGVFLFVYIIITIIRKIRRKANAKKGT